MGVTIFAGLYGDVYDSYVSKWLKAVKAAKPDRIIIGSDRDRTIDGVDVVVGTCTGTHPSAFFQNLAAGKARTEWVWQMQIDDLIHKDALTGLDEVTADVWQVGYDRTDGARYIPPALSAGELLAAPDNPFVMASPVRRKAFAAVGGYPDIAYEDWGLWRLMARAGYTFAAAGKTAFAYNWHPETSRTSQDARHRETNMSEALAL